MEHTNQTDAAFPFSLQKAVVFLRGCSIMAVVLFLAPLNWFWEWSVFGTPGNTGDSIQILLIAAIAAHITLFGFSFIINKETTKTLWVAAAAFIDIASIPIFYWAIGALFSFALNVPVCTGG